MAVDQVMRARRAIARTRGAREDHGIAFGGAEGGFQADLPAVLDQPLRAGFEIGFVLGLRRNAGETEISTEIVNETLLVLLEVIEDGLHAEVLNRIPGQAKFIRRRPAAFLSLQQRGQHGRLWRTAAVSGGPLPSGMPLHGPFIRARFFCCNTPSLRLVLRTQPRSQARLSLSNTLNAWRSPGFCLR